MPVQLVIGWMLGLVVLGLIKWRINNISTGVGWVLGWIGVMIIASVNTMAESMAGNYYRNDGLGMYLLLAAVAITIGMVKPRVDWILKWQMVASSIVSLAAVVVWFVPWVETWLPKSFVWIDGAVGLGFQNPHLLAGYLTVSCGIMATRWGMAKGWKRLGYGLLVAVHLVGVGVTQAYLFLGLCGVMVSWRWLFGSRKKWLSWMLTSVYMAAFVLWATVGSAVVDEPEGRLRMWYRGLMAWEERPWLGWGWARFGKAIEPIIWPTEILHDVYVDKAHSMWIEVLVTTGGLGLVTYGAVFWVAIRNLGRAAWKNVETKPWFGGLLAYILVSQLNVVPFPVEILGWIMVGFGLAATED